MVVDVEAMKSPKLENILHKNIMTWWYRASAFPHTRETGAIFRGLGGLIEIIYSFYCVVYRFPKSRSEYAG